MESLTTEGSCTEIRCDDIPETTESSSNLDTKFTSDALDTYDPTDPTYDTTMMYDNITPMFKSKSDVTHSPAEKKNISNEELTRYVGNTFNETEQLALRRLCWETMFGQELVKLTVMDLVRGRDNFKCNFEQSIAGFITGCHSYINNFCRFL